MNAHRQIAAHDRVATRLHNDLRYCTSAGFAPLLAPVIPADLLYRRLTYPEAALRYGVTIRTGWGALGPAYTWSRGAMAGADAHGTYVEAAAEAVQVLGLRTVDPVRSWYYVSRWLAERLRPMSEVIVDVPPEHGGPPSLPALWGCADPFSPFDAYCIRAIYRTLEPVS